ncbi:MAG: dihydropteroate synthase [Syntrophobacteraceae bacterium]|nr:dihydropteroate synthase [Desulfobacteraceae bacterium]
MSVHPRRQYVLRLQSRRLELGGRTLLMGILNVTPDSFSDAGKFFDPGSAVRQATHLIEAGADLLDIGGESTRPFSEPVSLEDELSRVIPVIRAIRGSSDLPISIDTTKAEVARQALEAGADIINDVSAMFFDREMADVAASSGAPVILMHMQGTPRTMQQSPEYASLFSEIIAFLEERIWFAVERGVERGQIIIDPGVGFGKNISHNLAIIRDLELFQCLDRPILLGTSRKGFIGKILDRPVEQREVGTAVAHAFGIAAGAHIIRAHDVSFHKQAALMADALRSA